MCVFKRKLASVGPQQELHRLYSASSLATARLFVILYSVFTSLVFVISFFYFFYFSQFLDFFTFWVTLMYFSLFQYLSFHVY